MPAQLAPMALRERETSIMLAASTLSRAGAADGSFLDFVDFDLIDSARPCHSQARTGAAAPTQTVE